MTASWQWPPQWHKCSLPQTNLKLAVSRVVLFFHPSRRCGALWSNRRKSNADIDWKRPFDTVLRRCVLVHSAALMVCCRRMDSLSWSNGTFGMSLGIHWTKQRFVSALGTWWTQQKAGWTCAGCVLEGAHMSKQKQRHGTHAYLRKSKNHIYIYIDIYLSTYLSI